MVLVKEKNEVYFVFKDEFCLREMVVKKKKKFQNCIVMVIFEVIFDL